MAIRARAWGHSTDGQVRDKEKPGPRRAARRRPGQSAGPIARHPRTRGPRSHRRPRSSGITPAVPGPGGRADEKGAGGYNARLAPPGTVQGVAMPRGTPPRLQVVTYSGRHFVMVPLPWAGDLRIYLRGKGVNSSPPEPVDGAVVSVELGRKTDTALVQGFLDGWVK